jgi:dTDP-4-amino-4,6-dideoxygalactose transaminase
MVYYPVPLHRMQVFAGRCKISGDLKESERATQEVLSLPIEPLMGKDDIERVVATVREGVENFRV